MVKLGMRIAQFSALAMCAAPASARDYYYFNKPTVSREAYAADIGECAELAGGARQPSTAPIYVAVPNSSYGAYGAAIGILFAGLLGGGGDRHIQRSVERTCMADKGYVRLKADKRLIREIEGIKDDEERLERLFDLASSANPIGERMGE